MLRWLRARPSWRSSGSHPHAHTPTQPPSAESVHKRRELLDSKRGDLLRAVDGMPPSPWQWSPTSFAHPSSQRSNSCFRFMPTSSWISCPTTSGDALSLSHFGLRAAFVLLMKCKPLPYTPSPTRPLGEARGSTALSGCSFRKISESHVSSLSAPLPPPPPHLTLQQGSSTPSLKSCPPPSAKTLPLPPHDDPQFVRTYIPQMTRAWLFSFSPPPPFLFLLSLCPTFSLTAVSAAAHMLARSHAHNPYSAQ